jgi:hypothetical protein
MISEIEQQTLDIDWFFTDGDQIGFVASGGGKLPESISLLDENNQSLVSFFRNLPEICDFNLNTELNSILNSNVSEEYLNDFIYIAKRGIYAFDKTILNDFSETNYHLVAKPTKSISIMNLPDEIKSKILNTECKHKLDKMLKINVLDIK